MHETKIHAKSFRFLYANYSKALEAGTLWGEARRVGEVCLWKKTFKIYARKDYTNKEVGMKTLRSRVPHSCWKRQKGGEIFQNKNL